jgi:hypothetical protein
MHRWQLPDHLDIPENFKPESPRNVPSGTIKYHSAAEDVVFL